MQREKAIELLEKHVTTPHIIRHCYARPASNSQGK